MEYKEEFYYLTQVIDVIFQKMVNYTNIFVEQNTNHFNLKRTCIDKILDIENVKIDDLFLETILLFEKIVKKEIVDALNEDKYKLTIDRRFKNNMSIQNKLYKYHIKDGRGKYPVQKCLNDLLGYRVLISSDIPMEKIFKDLQLFISEHYQDRSVKIQNASKQEYKALHVYFKINNLSFPCELQIWLKKDQQDNENSHRKYKQDYIDWEEYEKSMRKL